ncbi:hypothetical protein G6L28_01680 [Agrobacterium larrymoorei]|uniref:hypothetical protein n=1 Tax=Agrobacterium larrymoorei TaxID=160699 RepID=UPI0015749242|nr:hypothetical protein [Agrobacterium larrymoorei]NTJ41307.1 hypothetical protein [Agrobacterium larrymoorei]
MRREVYEQPKNEIEQQLTLHNLEKNMAQDYESSTRVLTKQDVKNLKVQQWGLLVFIVLMFGCFGLAVWLY